MATHSSTLAWQIPWTEEPSRLQFMGSPRVGYNWATSLPLFTFMHWRRKWQPTPVFLPGESQGRGSLGGLPPLGSHRVGHDWSDLAAAAAAATWKLNVFSHAYLPLVYLLLWSVCSNFCPFCFIVLLTFLLLNCRVSLCFLDNNSLSDICFVNIFSIPYEEKM